MLAPSAIVKMVPSKISASLFKIKFSSKKILPLNIFGFFAVLIITLLCNAGSFELNLSFFIKIFLPVNLLNVVR